MDTLTVTGLLILLDTWKNMRSSPAMMYETPYPSSATGPKPPPADMQSGFSFALNRLVWPWGVCEVDNLHGSLRTAYKRRENYNVNILVLLLLECVKGTILWGWVVQYWLKRGSVLEPGVQLYHSILSSWTGFKFRRATYASYASIYPPPRTPSTLDDFKKYLTFKNGESTSKYLETTYKQNKCLSIPLPIIASWQARWCTEHAFCNDFTLSSIWKEKNYYVCKNVEFNDKCLLNKINSLLKRGCEFNFLHNILHRCKTSFICVITYWFQTLSLELVKKKKVIYRFHFFISKDCWDIWAKNITLQFGSSIVLTHAADSTVHDLTVSVLPSLYNLVIDASYVRLNLPASCSTETILFFSLRSLFQ